MRRRKTKMQGATTQDTATENKFWHLVKDDQGLLSVNGNAPAQASEMSTTNESSSRSFIARVFLRTVLPVGYPQSVAPEYVKFQLYDTLQEASGYFRGLLSTQAYLTGLGVGDESTSPIAAVITTLILAYPAMVFGLLVGAMPSMVSAFSASQKRYQVFKEILLLVGTTLALVASENPAYFLHISAVAAAFSAVGNVMGSVSRSPLIQHLARADNYSDCAAKESNQSKLLKLILILVGYQFLVWVNLSSVRARVAFAALSLSKVAFVALSMKTLALRTLNEQRLFLLLKNWTPKLQDLGTPESVAAIEELFYSSRVTITTNVNSAIRKNNLSEVEVKAMITDKSDQQSKHLLVGNNVIAFPCGVDVRPKEKLLAFMHWFLKESRSKDNNVNVANLLGEAKKLLAEFQAQAVEKGWAVDRVLLPVST